MKAWVGTTAHRQNQAAAAHDHPDLRAALLTAVDAGLGACFFGVSVDRIDAFREAFGVPPQFTPIGAISIGYSKEPPRDLSSRRKPIADTVHRGRWSQPAG